MSYQKNQKNVQGGLIVRIRHIKERKSYEFER